MGRLHNGQRPYCCLVCGKTFRHRSYFKVHVQAHQRSSSSRMKTKGATVAQKPKDSTSCGVALAEPLEVTAVGVVQRQPLHAQIFEKQDDPARASSTVQPTSRPVRPFKCLQCGAAFKKVAHLNQHSRTHSGIKPFTCNICLRFDPFHLNLLHCPILI